MLTAMPCIEAGPVNHVVWSFKTPARHYVLINLTVLKRITCWYKLPSATKLEPKERKRLILSYTNGWTPLKDVIRTSLKYRWCKRLNLLSNAIRILERSLITKRSEVVYCPIVIEIMIINELLGNVWQPWHLCKLWVATCPVKRWSANPDLSVELSLFPWSWRGRKCATKAYCIIKRRLWLRVRPCNS
jgi:hypothetical protein